MIRFLFALGWVAYVLATPVIALVAYIQDRPKSPS